MREFNSESMRSYIKYLYTNEIEDIEVLNIPGIISYLKISFYKNLCL